MNAGETRGEETPKSNGKNVYLENLPHGTPVDPQRLVQRIVERGTVVMELLPQRLLGLGLIEVGRRCTGVLPLRLRARNGDVWGGQVRTRSVPVVGG
jgi:hypothetical protein